MFVPLLDLTATNEKIPRSIIFKILDFRLRYHHIFSGFKAIYTETTVNTIRVKSGLGTAN